MIVLYASKEEREVLRERDGYVSEADAEIVAYRTGEHTVRLVKHRHRPDSDLGNRDFIKEVLP